MAGPAPSVLPDMFRPPVRQAGNAGARVPTQGREEVKSGRATGVRNLIQRAGDEALALVLGARS